jgi:hypothetical protein
MPGRLHGPGRQPAWADRVRACLRLPVLTKHWPPWPWWPWPWCATSACDNGQPWAHGRKLRKARQQKQGTGCWGKEGVGWAEQTLRWLSERGAG